MTSNSRNFKNSWKFLTSNSWNFQTFEIFGNDIKFLGTFEIFKNDIKFLETFKILKSKKFLANFSILYQENTSQQKIDREIFPRILKILQRKKFLANFSTLYQENIIWFQEFQQFLEMECQILGIFEILRQFFYSVLKEYNLEIF